MSRATNIIAGNSKITLTTLHADWCTRIMGFEVIGHHGETEQRHGCICKSLGQSHMYPFRYTYMMAMVTRLCVLNELVDVLYKNQRFSLLVTRKMSPTKFLGFLHFMTGSDDISFLSGFSKNYCITNFVKYHTEICPDDFRDSVDLFDGGFEAMYEFFSRFLIMLYCKKYACCFEPKEWEGFCTDVDKDAVFRKIRDATWHKTIVTSNQLPTTSAIRLHCERLCFVMDTDGSSQKLKERMYCSHDGIMMMLLEKWMLKNCG